MKKVLVLLVVLVMAVGGCTTLQSWFCSNRDTINQYIDQAQQTIATINAQYGTTIPAQYEAIIIAAQVVIDRGQKLLAEMSCPTAADVLTVQDAAVDANKASLRAGMGMMLKVQRK